MYDMYGKGMDSTNTIHALRVCVCDAEATFFGFSYCILALDVAFLSSCSQEEKMFWYKFECVVCLRERCNLKQSGLKKNVY